MLTADRVQEWATSATHSRDRVYSQTSSPEVPARCNKPGVNNLPRESTKIKHEDGGAKTKGNDMNPNYKPQKNKEKKKQTPKCKHNRPKHKQHNAPPVLYRATTVMAGRPPTRTWFGMWWQLIYRVEQPYYRAV